jgi:hypothetical protein
MTVVLMLGSAVMALRARAWPKQAFDRVLAINNAWRLRPDWDAMIHPWDFPADRVPQPGAGQRVVTEADFVPAQNAYGGFVYGGGTMAFTAAYWALHALRPQVIAAFGCDMHYPPGSTHFYGAGTPDPLRNDISLRSLEAKATRLEVIAALQGCAMVNLSDGPSRLTFARVGLDGLRTARPRQFDAAAVAAAVACEASLGYFAPSGRYWETPDAYDTAKIDALDALWLACAATAPGLER